MGQWNTLSSVPCFFADGTRIKVVLAEAVPQLFVAVRVRVLVALGTYTILLNLGVTLPTNGGTADIT